MTASVRKMISSMLAIKAMRFTAIKRRGIRDAIINQQFMVRAIDKVNVFMALNEKKVAAICFPTNEGRMDYRGFVSEDKAVHKWAKDLYEYYWANSTYRELAEE